jgi:Uma2 family endonuclease
MSARLTKGQKPMSNAQAENIAHISEDDYLSGELVSEIKHEYVDGAVYAMAGASRNHERIVQNLSRLFGNHLVNSPCEPLGSDMKVRTSIGKFRYPDYMVVCDEIESHEQYTDSPVILVEVLSKTTRKIDHQIKRLEYINIPSLKEYVLIEQDFVDIIVLRKSDHWQATHYFLGEDVVFESIDLTLPVAELYHRVDNHDMVQWLESIASSDSGTT